MNLFSSSPSKFTILSFNGSLFNGNPKSNLHGFGMFISSNTSYYVPDHQLNKVYIWNSDWSEVSYSSNFSVPNYMISVNCTLYLTTNETIYNTDQYLNVFIQLCRKCIDI